MTFISNLSSIQSEHKNDLRKILEKTFKKREILKNFSNFIKVDESKISDSESSDSYKLLKINNLGLFRKNTIYKNNLNEMQINQKVLKEQIENKKSIKLNPISLSFETDEVNYIWNYDEINESLQSSTKNNSHNVKNFSTDDLIYKILLISLEKLEEFSEHLTMEFDLLKNIYLELSEEEKNKYFKKIHSIEVSLQLISQEMFLRRRFLKFAKIKFKLFNKITKNFYFNRSFNFLCEIMTARLIQNELNLSKLKNLIQIMKENFDIIIEDSEEKEDNRLNMNMKIIAIITAIFTPFNCLASLFGLNVKLPFATYPNFYPFFGIIFFLILLSIFQISIFRKWKWI